MMDEQKLRDYYNSNPGQFTDVINTAHILVEEEALAQSLLARAEGGEDFAALARAHSICPSAAKGGELGFYPNGLAVAPYEQAAHALEQVGQLSPPVQSRFGYHIIKLLDKKPLLPFDECKAVIASILERQQQSE